MARQDEGQRRGRGLGWMSLGLGVAQLAAPDTVRRISGVDDSATSRAVVPLVGARGLVHAAGLLASRRESVWAWSRVVGEAMDLTRSEWPSPTVAGAGGGGSSVSPAPWSGSPWWTC